MEYFRYLNNDRVKQFRDVKQKHPTLSNLPSYVVPVLYEPQKPSKPNFKVSLLEVTKTAKEFQELKNEAKVFNDLIMNNDIVYETYEEGYETYAYRDYAYKDYASKNCASKSYAYKDDYAYKDHKYPKEAEHCYVDGWIKFVEDDGTIHFMEDDGRIRFVEDDGRIKFVEHIPSYSDYPISSSSYNFYTSDIESLYSDQKYTAESVEGSSKASCLYSSSSNKDDNLTIVIEENTSELIEEQDEIVNQKSGGYNRDVYDNSSGDGRNKERRDVPNLIEVEITRRKSRTENNNSSGDGRNKRRRDARNEIKIIKSPQNDGMQKDNSSGDGSNKGVRNVSIKEKRNVPVNRRRNAFINRRRDMVVKRKRNVPVKVEKLGNSDSEESNDGFVNCNKITEKGNGDQCITNNNKPLKNKSLSQNKMRLENKNVFEDKSSLEEKTLLEDKHILKDKILLKDRRLLEEVRRVINEYCIKHEDNFSDEAQALDNEVAMKNKNILKQEDFLKRRKRRLTQEPICCNHLEKENALQLDKDLMDDNSEFKASLKNEGIYIAPEDDAKIDCFNEDTPNFEEIVLKKQRTLKTNDCCNHKIKSNNENDLKKRFNVKGKVRSEQNLGFKDKGLGLEEKVKLNPKNNLKPGAACLNKIFVQNGSTKKDDSFLNCCCLQRKGCLQNRHCIADDICLKYKGCLKDRCSLKYDSCARDECSLKYDSCTRDEIVLKYQGLLKGQRYMMKGLNIQSSLKSEDDERKKFVEDDARIKFVQDDCRKKIVEDDRRKTFLKNDERITFLEDDRRKNFMEESTLAMVPEIDFSQTDLRDAKKQIFEEGNTIGVFQSFQAKIFKLFLKHFFSTIGTFHVYFYKYILRYVLFI